MNNGAIATRALILRVLKLVLPMTGSRLIQIMSNFIGIVMLAHLGHTVLAASNLISISFVFVLVVITSLFYSVSVVTGQIYGAERFNQIAVLVQQAILLSLILGSLTILLFWRIDHVLLLFHQDPKLVYYVEIFFHAVSWAAISAAAFVATWATVAADVSSPASTRRLVSLTA